MDDTKGANLDLEDPAGLSVESNMEARCLVLLRRQDVSIVGYRVKQSGCSGSVLIVNSILMLDRDCHALWHMPNFDEKRDQWIRQKSAKSPGPTETSSTSMQTRSQSGESQS